jgi:hypothetical protein
MLDPDPKSKNPDPETLPVVPISGRCNLAERLLKFSVQTLPGLLAFLLMGLEGKKNSFCSENEILRSSLLIIVDFCPGNFPVLLAGLCISMY